MSVVGDAIEAQHATSIGRHPGLSSALQPLFRMHKAALSLAGFGVPLQHFETLFPARHNAAPVFVECGGVEVLRAPFHLADGLAQGDAPQPRPALFADGHELATVWRKAEAVHWLLELAPIER